MKTGGPIVRGEPSDPVIHIYIADLGSEYAVEVQTPDGQQYCIFDKAVLDDDPEARASAFEVFLKACKSASQPHAALAG
jgi:hypothetical protein